MTEKKKQTKINRLKENSYGGNRTSHPGGTVNQADRETKGEEKQKLSTYEKAVMNCLTILGTPKADWTALPLVGVKETEDSEGKSREVPVYDFTTVAKYTHAPSPYQSNSPGDMCCELCAHQIKTAYFVVNHKEKMYMAVGSECIIGFGVDLSASGKDMVKEVKKDLKEDLVVKLKGITLLLQDVVSVLYKEKQSGSSITKNLSQLVRVFELIVSNKVLQKGDVSQNMNTRIVKKYLKLNEEKGIEKTLNSVMGKLTGIEHDLLGNKPETVRMSVERYCEKVAVIKKEEASGAYIVPYEQLYNHRKKTKQSETQEVKIREMVQIENNWYGYRFIALDKSKPIEEYDFSYRALISKHILNQYETLGWIKEGAYKKNIQKEYVREMGY